MPLKNSNAVAAERRADLASLFCMIGRHGPAVALAVVAMVSVLAAFIIYRTVRGKRRKATATATAAAGGEQRDASVRRPLHEPSPDESFSSADSTDVSDEGSSDVKEDAYLIQSHPTIRLRSAAAANEKKPPPCSPPKSDLQVPHNNHAMSDDTEVFKADYQEDETTDENLSDKGNGEEETLQCALTSPVHFDQTPHMSENIDDTLQGNERPPETNSVEFGLEEPVIRQFQEENQHPDSSDYSNGSRNNQLGPEEEKNKGEEMALVHNGDGVEDGDLASEVTEEVLDKDYLNQFTAVKFDTDPPELEKQKAEIKQEDGLPCSQEGGVLPIVVDQLQEKILTGDNIAAFGKECDCWSLVPSSSPLHSSQSIMVYDHSLSGITTDAKVQISGIVDFKDCQHSQSEEKEDEVAPHLDKDTSVNILQSESVSVLAEESIDPQDQQKHDEDIVGHKPDKNVTAYVITKDSCLKLPSICQEQQSEHMETSEAFTKTRVDSATDAAACDNASITAPIMSEGMSHPDMLSSIQDRQSDKKEKNEVASGVAPVLTNVISPPICKINLLSFEQSELRDNDNGHTSSPGVGVESGISSMTVSPDLQDAGNEFDMAVDAMVLPEMGFDSQPEKRTEAQNSLFADDAALSVINEDTESMAFGSYQSVLSQRPISEPTDWAKYESFAANEDMFGSDIDDSYYSALDQFIAQIAANVTSFTSELKKTTDIKGVVKGIEIKECSGVNVQKKTEIEEEKEKEEDYEKTEISIMEATMDNNEWITDSNYQVPPWMNVSIPSFAQDSTKTSQLPNEGSKRRSSLRDAACKDTDGTPCTEVKPPNALSFVDENTEQSKKVVAVQPMPQNVSVTFRIHYLTHSPYQTVAVTGNQQELGNWKGFIPLERAKDGHWATVVSLPAESHVEWKFVVVEKGEVCRWEECGNRLLDTGVGDDLVVYKWWGLL